MKQPKSKKGFYKEMNSRIASVTDGKSNCIGTLAYNILEIDGDAYVSRADSEEMFSKMKYLGNLEEVKKKGNLEEGHVVAWYTHGFASGRVPFHAGAVTNPESEEIENIEIAERRKTQGEFNPHAKIGEVDAYLKREEQFAGAALIKSEIKVFAPSKLQKFLNKDGGLK